MYRKPWLRRPDRRQLRAELRKGLTPARGGEPRCGEKCCDAEEKKAGKSIDEVAASWKIPAKYSGYAAADANRLKNNVKLAYSEVDKGTTN